MCKRAGALGVGGGEEGDSGVRGRGVGRGDGSSWKSGYIIERPEIEQRRQISMCTEVGNKGRVEKDRSWFPSVSKKRR